MGATVGLGVKADDVDKSYEFLIKGRFLEPTGTISKAKLGKVVDALKELGDIPADFAVARLLMPTTKAAD